MNEVNKSHIFRHENIHEKYKIHKEQRILYIHTILTLFVYIQCMHEYMHRVMSCSKTGQGLPTNIKMSKNFLEVAFEKKLSSETRSCKISWIVEHCKGVERFACLMAWLSEFQSEPCPPDYYSIPHLHQTIIQYNKTCNSANLKIN
jgi:hypothetical protein